MEEKSTTDILLAGVGGQGIILASEILASICLTAGYDVKQSEVHGMAQRGGSVTSHVRFGPRVDSPTIERGRADFLISFEMLEAVRWIDTLHADGAAFVNTQQIKPITVSVGAAEYPDGLESAIEARCKHVVFVNGLALAQQAGNVRAVNVALLGALSTQLEFDMSMWKECIGNRVPPKTLEINLAAFNAGRDAAELAGKR